MLIGMDVKTQYSIPEFAAETPAQQTKAAAWQAAIGLQDVDNLKVSPYLRETATQNIQGQITDEEAKNRIAEYYQSKDKRNSPTREADTAAANIAALLAENGFHLSPAGFIATHKYIFRSMDNLAGIIRDYNITKKEWILNGDTVEYAPFYMIHEALEYDFDKELKHKQKYAAMSAKTAIARLARFIANLWQIHPFKEGNTRSTSIFFIKYLNSLRFAVNNSLFAQNSWYFRNALVRANYANPQIGIMENTAYLEQFIVALILGVKLPMRNRELHIENKDKPPADLSDIVKGTFAELAASRGRVKSN